MISVVYDTPRLVLIVPAHVRSPETQSKFAWKVHVGLINPDDLRELWYQDIAWRHFFFFFSLPISRREDFHIFSSSSLCFRQSSTLQYISGIHELVDDHKAGFRVRESSIAQKVGKFENLTCVAFSTP